MDRDFGIFEQVFQGGHGYLSLLHLSSFDTGEVVAQVARLAHSSSKPYEEIGVLLEDSNWRPHLVAAVALMVLDYDQSVFLKLWRTIDCGSWVTPQLAAVAFSRDPDFAEQSYSRLKDLCPIETSQLRSMSPIERHSAAGPAGSVHRSAKMAAALMRLASLLPEQPSWFVSEQANSKINELIKKDFDDSAEVAEVWLADIKRLVSN